MRYLPSEHPHRFAEFCLGIAVGTIVAAVCETAYAVFVVFH